MSLEVEVVVEETAWGDLEGLCGAASAGLAKYLDLPDGCSAVVLGCSDARIAALNAAFRAKHQATNVLSWPQQDLAANHPGAAPEPPEPDPFDGEIALGDIALALETCQREADAAGRPFAHHVQHLVIHGLLHLLGYDHIAEEDADLMERLEVEILATLEIPDPYM
ncbi:MAG: rRNA maturation RNase YbeY [Pseudomonadota bacterium]